MYTLANRYNDLARKIFLSRNSNIFIFI